MDDHQKIAVSANTFASPAFGFDRFFNTFRTYTRTNLFQRGATPSDIVSNQDSILSQSIDFLQSVTQQDFPIRTLLNGVWSKASKDPLPGIVSSLPGRYYDDDGARTISATAQSLVNRSEEPYFLFLNYMDAHSPHHKKAIFDETLHNLPEDWHSDQFPAKLRTSQDPFGEYDRDVGYYRDAYAASVDYVDRVVSEFIEQLIADSERETTVVVTSDHGETLGYKHEEYILGHNSLHEATTHVPLEIINPPGSIERTIEQPVSHLNLGRLLTQMADDALHLDECSREVVPAEVLRAGGIKKTADEDVAHLNKAVRAAYRESEAAVWDTRGNCRVSRTDIRAPSVAFDIEDRSESPAWAREQFEEQLSVFADDYRDISVESTTENRLRELGYLS